MKTMNSKDIITKKVGGEYLVTVAEGEVFVSIHTVEGNCLAFYLTKSDLKITVLHEVFGRVCEYLPANEHPTSEVKIIGRLGSIRLLEDFFVPKNFQSIKKIEKEKDGVMDVMFLPLLNKVRVSKTESEVASATPTTKFKVMIIDDSKTIRSLLSRMISSDPMFEICAMAEKPSEVEELILKHRPDVITLDIHLPEMNGVMLLKEISGKYNIPTIVVSSISQDSSAEGPLVLEALENGAIDYIQKPEFSEIQTITPILLEKIRTAAKANLKKSPRTKNVSVIKTTQKCDLSSMIVLGSSTGGTEAIRQILLGLPDQIPPMLIVQHIPAVFSLAFARRMNELCPFEVKEAENGDEVKANRVLIAPGGRQMKFVHRNGKSFVEVNDDEPVNRFKPSVDYMFMSVAKNIYTNTVAVILTGMGKDGAKGILELRNLGARTVVQDELSSVVFGMPKEAIAIGGAEYIESLKEIAERVTILTKEKSGIKKAS